MWNMVIFGLIMLFVLLGLFGVATAHVWMTPKEFQPKSRRELERKQAELNNQLPPENR